VMAGLLQLREGRAGGSGMQHPARGKAGAGALEQGCCVRSTGRELLPAAPRTPLPGLFQGAAWAELRPAACDSSGPCGRPSYQGGPVRRSAPDRRPPQLPHAISAIQAPDAPSRRPREVIARNPRQRSAATTSQQSAAGTTRRPRYHPLGIWRRWCTASDAARTPACVRGRPQPSPTSAAGTAQTSSSALQAQGH
jgi:hypothetical protein